MTRPRHDGSRATLADRPADGDTLPLDRDRLSRARLPVLALVATRLGDVIITYHGLRTGLVEANPIARATMSAVGVTPALVGWSTLVVATIIGVGTLGERALAAAGASPARRRTARSVWYGVPALLWLGVCVYNAVLVAGVG